MNTLDLQVLNPPGLYDPTPNGYSHIMVVRGGSQTAFIAGQGGEDQTGSLSPDFVCQVRQAFANLQTALDSIGASPEQIAKLTTYVVDHDQEKLRALTDCAMDFFGGSFPAQTLVPVPRLALDDMLFEVDAVVILYGG